MSEHKVWGDARVILLVGLLVALVGVLMWERQNLHRDLSTVRWELCFRNAVAERDAGSSRDVQRIVDQCDAAFPSE
jgi:hypothetical protein